MNRPPFEVANLIRSAGTAFLERNRQWLRWKHVKVLLAIARCRTATLGGHLDQCTRCGHRAISTMQSHIADMSNTTALLLAQAVVSLSRSDLRWGLANMAAAIAIPVYRSRGNRSFSSFAAGRATSR
jgi:Transposase zinc-binding domain